MKVASAKPSMTTVSLCVAAVLGTSACTSGGPGVTSDGTDLGVEVVDTMLMSGISDSVGFSSMSLPTTLNDGRIVVAPLTESGTIAVFERDGRFQGLAGRPGPGPQELGRVERVLAHRTRGILVFHRSHASDARLSGTDLTVMNATPVPQFNDIVGIGDSLFIATFLAMPGSGESPLRLLSSQFESVKSFETPFGELEGDITVLHAADAGSGKVIVAPLTGYAFAQIDLVSGAASRVMVRNIRFPIQRLRDLDRRQPDVARPYSRILHLRVGSDGLLRVLYATSRPDWQPSSVSETSGEGDVLPIQEYSRFMNFFLDILDVRSGEVVGATDIPGVAVRMINDTTLAGYVSLPTDDIGVVRYRIVQR